MLPSMGLAMPGGDSRVLALETGREAALPPGALGGPHAGILTISNESLFPSAGTGEQSFGCYMA